MRFPHLNRKLEIETRLFLSLKMTCLYILLIISIYKFGLFHFLKDFILFIIHLVLKLFNIGKYLQNKLTVSQNQIQKNLNKGN